MSMELYVALPKGALPPPAELVARAAGAGFAIGFEDGFSLEAASGFQPIRLAGAATGVEIDLWGLADLPEFDDVFGDKAGTLERIVAFRWGGDFVEAGLAYVLAGALAVDERSVCYDPQEDAVLPPTRLAEIAADLLAEAQSQAAASPRD